MFDWEEWKRGRVVGWAAATASRRNRGRPPLAHPWWWTSEWQDEVDALLAKWAATPGHWTHD
jgi:hypothetical protein